MDRDKLKKKLEPYWSERPVWKDTSVGDGWLPIIDRLVTNLAKIYPAFRIVQIKEKFGTLRFYIEAVPTELYPQVSREIEEAELKSAEVCESCGKPGKMRDERYWMKTMCDECDHNEQERLERK